jgi:hypothetical protein
MGLRVIPAAFDDCRRIDFWGGGAYMSRNKVQIINNGRTHGNTDNSVEPK